MDVIERGVQLGARLQRFSDRHRGERLCWCAMAHLSIKQIFR